MRPESYLITTSVGKASRKIIWQGEGKMDLDYPDQWTIEHDQGKIRIVDTSDVEIHAALDQIDRVVGDIETCAVDEYNRGNIIGIWEPRGEDADCDAAASGPPFLARRRLTRA